MARDRYPNLKDQVEILLRMLKMIRDLQQVEVVAINNLAVILEKW